MDCNDKRFTRAEHAYNVHYYNLQHTIYCTKDTLFFILSIAFTNVVAFVVITYLIDDRLSRVR